MELAEFIDSISPEWYFLFIFFSSFLENIFPPYPGDTVTVIGAYMVGISKINIFVLIISVFVGSIAGAVFMYFMGPKVIYFFSNKLKIRFFTVLANENSIQKAEKWFHKYGILSIILSRFSAGIRFFISIVAGVVRMNLFLFIIAFSIGTILWNAILIYAGYIVGNHWEKIIEILRIYNLVLGGIIVIIFIFFITYKRKRKINTN